MSKAKAERIREYMQDKVKPVFDQLITELILSMPEDVVDWSIKWLLKKQGKVQIFDNQQSEEDEEEVVDEIGVSKKKVGRQSVSAEVYGEFNKKENFKPRVIEKSEDQVARIRDKLTKSFMFEALDENELKIVIDAMEEKSFKQEDWVIQQGDDGNELYVVDEGELDCFKKLNQDQPQKYLKTYKPGESFGELALLYNMPRAASIQAKTDVVAFALDRETFSNIVKDSAIKKREYFQENLKKIELLDQMDDYERMQLSDGIKELRVKSGETVIQEGEIGDKFYMILEGELHAEKAINIGDDPVSVFSYQAGDYFGELSLLKNTTRQATIIADVY